MATAGRVKTERAPRTATTGGGRVDLAQQRRIILFAERDEDRTAGLGECELTLDLFEAGDPDRFAARRESRQRLERRPRTAKAIDQDAERARPDRFAAPQPQPVEALRIREPQPRFGAHVSSPILPVPPIFVSVPLTSRAILARCVNQSRSVSRLKSAATSGWPKASAATGVAALAVSAAAEE